MHKNALFFEKKKGKSPQRWGLCPQPPLTSGGLRPYTPELLLSSHVTVIFSKALLR